MSAPDKPPSREQTLAALLADPHVARGFRDAERVIVAEARAGGDRFVRLGTARAPSAPPRPTLTPPAYAGAPRAAAPCPPQPTPTAGVPGRETVSITVPRRTTR